MKKRELSQKLIDIILDQNITIEEQKEVLGIKQHSLV